MKFIDYIKNLQNIKSVNARYTPNHTLLIGFFDGMTDRVSTYALYPPMTTQMITDLQNAYRYAIPEQLLEIFRVINGCSLCAGWMKLGDYRLPTYRLHIMGIPTGSAYVDCQPFDITVEDGDRPSNAPKSWLKFGYYTELREEIFYGEYDLFVDTVDGTVWGYTRKQKRVNLKKPDFHWDSIDECLYKLCEQAEKNLRNENT